MAKADKTMDYDLTKERWHYQEGNDAYTHIVRDLHGGIVAQLSQDSSGWTRRVARLVAKAPELLSVAEMVLECIDEFSGEIRVDHLAYDAIDLRMAAELAVGEAMGINREGAKNAKEKAMKAYPLETDPATAKVLGDVYAERSSQNAKWGEQNHHQTAWLAILGEEFGELCQAVIETIFDNGPEAREIGGIANIRREAIQVAAVAVAMIECLDRNFPEPDVHETKERPNSKKV